MFEEDMERAKNERTTEDDAVAACRDWYDWKKYDKPFCCQMILATDKDGNKFGMSNVVDAKSTEKAESVEWEERNVEFGALTFKSAQALASGMAMVSTVVAFMN
jgi:hypothetical protein